MTVYGCPVCELRFPTKNERDWHLHDEHGSHRIHHPTPTADPLTEFRRAHEASEPVEPGPGEEGR